MKKYLSHFVALGVAKGLYFCEKIQVNIVANKRIK